ncbi:hypothetical protein FRC19_011556 [Serendipita sp. 401]|nr:hypothetical protein FRC15_002112 [Serendipita sp. 397]KAG8773888.1 hypothetical protein FRC16_005272 [Serendipita sp. 398]KAG8827855.1 hypothetical protein FRC19_011556 [Serendipita sp. 401]KAG8850283.1 hypothetical protein FRC20_002093 [Serendipita sp. 405]KAG9058205.1 hypothetical protein FS842_000146 [Serendipita sp. 407]
MFATSTTFVNVVVRGEVLTVQADDMHELETVPEMHGVPSLFDNWTSEEFDQFERELWPLPATFDDLSGLLKSFSRQEEVLTVPPTPTMEGSMGTLSSIPSTVETNDVTPSDLEGASSTSNGEKFMASRHGDRRYRVGAYKPFINVDSQGSTNASVQSLEATDSEQPLPKDDTGYAHPTAIYTRLMQQPKVRTADLDGMIAPAKNAHVSRTVKGKTTIRCRLDRSIKNGFWAANCAGRCGTIITGLESYRRHIIQCHLDVPRVGDKTQDEVIAMQLEAIIAAQRSSTANTTTPSSTASLPPLARETRRSAITGKRQLEVDSDSREESGDDDDLDDPSFVPTKGNTSKKRRIGPK